MSLIIITSGAYVGSELEAEFGRLPPSFLPVGHSRLFEAQAESLADLGDQIYLTIPDDYQVPPADEVRLKQLGLKTLPTPRDMTLGNAILYALNVSQQDERVVHVLHGDTLATSAISSEADVVAVAKRPESYDWGSIEQTIETGQGGITSEGEILAGYFSFGDLNLLRKSIALARGDFVTGLRLYDQERGLKRVMAADWRDYGHLQTFYRSRCLHKTQRAFNKLDLSFKTVTKSSDQIEKIEAETHWYRNIPERLRLYAPAFLGSAETANGNLAYSLEYLPHPTLHELYIFGDLGSDGWHKILEGCADFMRDCRAEFGEAPQDQASVLRNLTEAKTLERLALFYEQSSTERNDEWRFNGSAVPSLGRILELIADIVDFDSRDHISIMHGDFCFTNIFYDFRTQRVRVIDPRGAAVGSSASIWGDNRYDLAKLSHSIIGGYDLILSGRYELLNTSTRDLSLVFPPLRSRDILTEFAEGTEFLELRLVDPEIIAICIHLFISMLPLHSDSPERQKAFVANALRLFLMLDRGK